MMAEAGVGSWGRASNRSNDVNGWLLFPFFVTLGIFFPLALVFALEFLL